MRSGLPPLKKRTDTTGLLMVPTLRVVTPLMTLCVIRDVAHAVGLCDLQETAASGLRCGYRHADVSTERTSSRASSLPQVVHRASVSQCCTPARLLMVPTLRVVTPLMTLCVIRDVAHAVRLCDLQETAAPGGRRGYRHADLSTERTSSRASLNSHRLYIELRSVSAARRRAC
jgi:hypothetical protein